MGILYIDERERDMMLVDLHLHTTMSDGQMTPANLIELAKEKKLACISITDHDTIEAYEHLTEKDIDGIEIIPGIEFSTTYKQRSVHVLGYGFDINNKEMGSFLRVFKEQRDTRIKKMVENCDRLGYGTHFSELIALFPGQGVWGRPHLANLLISKGYFESVGNCFDALLAKGRPAYEPKPEIHPRTVVELIKKAGGLAVLAHPVLVCDDEVVRELLTFGFDGIEVYYPKQAEAKISLKYLAMAKEFGILVTGGSDFHAMKGRYPSTLGEYRVEAEKVEDFLGVLSEKAHTCKVR